MLNLFCITRNRAKIDMLTRASIAGISLRQRLLIPALLTSGIGLLLGCGANLFLELHNAKVNTVQDLRSTADLTGTNRRFAFNLEVLDPASLPKRPSSPNRLVIAAMGLAGGLLIGALTAAVARTRPSTDPAGNSPKSS